MDTKEEGKRKHLLPQGLLGMTCLDKVATTHTYYYCATASSLQRKEIEAVRPMLSQRAKVTTKTMRT